MPRYIDADSLKSSVKAFNGGKQDLFVSMIECTPTADVAEVKHGRNNTKMHPVDEFICSECGLILSEWQRVVIDEDENDVFYYEFEFNYCPHCGAKMGGNDEINNAKHPAKMV